MVDLAANGLVLYMHDLSKFGVMREIVPMVRFEGGEVRVVCGGAHPVSLAVKVHGRRDIRHVSRAWK